MNKKGCDESCENYRLGMLHYDNCDYDKAIIYLKLSDTEFKNNDAEYAINL